MDRKELLEKIDQQIAAAHTKAEDLSKKLGVKIQCVTFTEFDDNDKETGRVLKAYIKQPHIMVAARAMDHVIAKEFYQAGVVLFPACIMDESDEEISDENLPYKLGLCPQLGFKLLAQAPDVKKS